MPSKTLQIKKTKKNKLSSATMISDLKKKKNKNLLLDEISKLDKMNKMDKIDKDEIILKQNKSKNKNVEKNCDKMIEKYELHSCISFKNKSSNERCGKKTSEQSYFCGIHKRSKNPKFFISPQEHFKKHLKYNYHLVDSDYAKLKKGYKTMCQLKINYFINKNYQKKKTNMIKMLDEEYSYYLIGGEYSWKEIPYKFIYKINDKEYWDIRFLLKHFTQQINHCNMSEPAPQYPSSPMTRIKYSLAEMRNFYNKVKKLGIKIHPSLNLVLTMNLEKIFKKQKKEDDRAASEKRFPRDFFKKYLTDKLSISMRFAMFNEKDSQNNYIGHWVNKRDKLTDFEKLYKEWNNMAPFVYIRNTLISNPERGFFSQILESCERETWNLDEYYA